MADRGDPIPCKPAYAELARKFCLPGTTGQERTDGIEVDRRAIEDWLRTRPGFAGGVRCGRDVANALATRRLFDRAMGCGYEATKLAMVKGEAVTGRYTVNLPPDTRACVAWLRDCRRSRRRMARPEPEEQGDRLDEAAGQECLFAERTNDCARDAGAAGSARTAAELQTSAGNTGNTGNSTPSLKSLKLKAFRLRISWRYGMPENAANSGNSFLLSLSGSARAILRGSVSNVRNSTSRHCNATAVRKVRKVRKVTVRCTP